MNHHLAWRWAFVTLLASILTNGCSKPQGRVVLYCAQDEEFANQVLGEFTKRTGLPVDPKFDTEATKSVSLYTELVQEKARPRCDVHWNNEIIATIRLQRLGLLAPYASPSAESYPDFARAPDHTWHAFAARARILLVNTQLVPEGDWPRSMLDLTAPRWKGKVAMAKPEFGTSATQAACLFAVLGPDKAKGFYQGLRDNDVHIRPGNKDVAVEVGQGRHAIGITDTDDAITEVEAGRPVAIIFPDRDRPKEDPMGTLFIPNTLAMIQGCPNPQGARQLIDYLLSTEVEAKLAETESHQIPLNPQVKAHLPKQILTPQAAKPMDVDFNKATDMWDETQVFLQKVFAR